MKMFFVLDLNSDKEKPSLCNYVTVDREIVLCQAVIAYHQMNVEIGSSPP